MNCFYQCDYGNFFRNLAEVEQVLKLDRYTYHHYTYYVREMRVKAYNQLLDSYSSVTIQVSYKYTLNTIYITSMNARRGWAYYFFVL